jgi:aspartate 1-decarboxylase
MLVWGFLHQLFREFERPMLRTLLLGKIHSCTITAANLNYMGSISIDELLLQAANIVPYEQVQVVNVNNGQRFMTYAIVAPKGSGAIELNGAAARLGEVGDRLIIMTYAQLNNTEISHHCPQVAMVDGQNKLVEVLQYDDLLSEQITPITVSSLLGEGLA